MELPVLDQLCTLCLGYGRVNGRECGECDGSGYQMTEEGKAILDMIDRHMSAHLNRGLREMRLGPDRS